MTGRVLPSASLTLTLMPTGNRPARHKSRSIVSIVVTLIVVLGLAYARQKGWITSTPSGTSPASTTPSRAPAASDEIIRAFRERRSDTWVEASGEVVKTLPDDDEGDPHQRFLVRIDGTDGLTVLVAHNLNAADRVPISEGDHLRLRGEYEWTDKGGTVHFTHAPLQKRSTPGGWIEFDGRRYE